ncbi:prepilin peptidase [Helicobacter burdigaliensis]|uniref:prepilin peptidase n=1 Tax=Helicobacter burdigaliensis TaxID=2315334 RepID=UPI000EF743A8|nr:A24 family peptidase [Helicobacter burdigaliensis]
MEYIFICILGCILASFFNIFVSRIPKGVSIIAPRSFCQNCHKTLKFYELIPLFSYLFLKGVCKNCKAKIGFWQFLAELFGGIMGIVCYYLFGILGIFYLLFFLCFLALALLDYFYFEIPDNLNLLLFLFANLCGFYFLEKTDSLGFLISGLVLVGFAEVLRFLGGALFRKEIMGEGDVLIFGSMGATFGVISGMIGIFLGSVFALFYLSIYKQKKIPFVPFLFLGTFSEFLVKYFFV